MLDVCIFAPLAWERAAVAAGLGRCHAAGTRRWHGIAPDGHTILLLQSGVGPRYAAAAAVSAPVARCFIVCGCAGALAPGLRPGDLVLADAVRDRDTATSFPTVASPILAWAARVGVPMTRGAMLTTGAPLAGSVAKRAAAASGALAIDMESAAIARVAAARNVPLVVLRAVLDGLDDPLPAVNLLDPPSGEVRVGAALAHFLPPTRWPTALRLARRQRLAARAIERLSSLLAGPGGPLSACMGDATRYAT